MTDRHLFVLPPGIYRGANIAEMQETAKGLHEMDLFRLPYPRDVYVQILASEVATFGEESILPDPRVICLVGPLGDEQFADVRLLNSQTGWGESLLINPHRSMLPMVEQASKLVDCVMLLLIVLLATKNIVKTTKQNKLAKLGIGKKRFSNRFAYTTTISLPTDLDDDPDHPPTGRGVLPHLRRGHIRRQHYGPAHAYVKKVWIDPVFVNADPDFVSARKAYNVSLPAEAVAPGNLSLK